MKRMKSSRGKAEDLRGVGRGAKSKSIAWKIQRDHNKQKKSY